MRLAQPRIPLCFRLAPRYFSQARRRISCSLPLRRCRCTLSRVSNCKSFSGCSRRKSYPRLSCLPVSGCPDCSFPYNAPLRFPTLCQARLDTAIRPHRICSHSPPQTAWTHRAYTVGCFRRTKHDIRLFPTLFRYCHNYTVYLFLCQVRFRIFILNYIIYIIIILLNKS